MELGNEYSSQGDDHVGQVWQQAVGREQLEAQVSVGAPCLGSAMRRSRRASSLISL